MILYLNTHIYNDKKGNGAESSRVAACIGGTGRLVSQDEMRCVWRTGRIGRGSFTSITTWKDLQAWKTKEAKHGRATAPLWEGRPTTVRQDTSPEMHNDQKLLRSLLLALQIRSHRETAA